MENFKQTIVLGISVVENYDSLTVIKPAEVIVNGETQQFPLAVLKSNREDLHKFIDKFFDELEK